MLFDKTRLESILPNLVNLADFQTIIPILQKWIENEVDSVDLDLVDNLIQCFESINHRAESYIKQNIVDRVLIPLLEDKNPKVCSKVAAALSRFLKQDMEHIIRNRVTDNIIWKLKKVGHDEYLKVVENVAKTLKKEDHSGWGKIALDLSIRIKDSNTHVRSEAVKTLIKILPLLIGQPGITDILISPLNVNLIGDLILELDKLEFDDYLNVVEGVVKYLAGVVNRDNLGILEKITQSLIERLWNGNPDVRLKVVKTVGHILQLEKLPEYREIDSKLIAVLTERLGDTNRDTFLEVVNIFNQNGPRKIKNSARTSARIVQVMLPLLEDEERVVRVVAMNFIEECSWASLPDELIAKIIPTLSANEALDVRLVKLRALSYAAKWSLLPGREKVIGVMIPLLENTQKKIRLVAVDTFCVPTERLKLDDRKMRTISSHLLPRLKDKDPDIRFSAQEALSKLFKLDKSLFKKLKKLNQIHEKILFFSKALKLVDVLADSIRVVSDPSFKNMGTTLIDGAKLFSLLYGPTSPILITLFAGTVIKSYDGQCISPLFEQINALDGSGIVNQLQSDPCREGFQNFGTSVFEGAFYFLALPQLATNMASRWLSFFLTTRYTNFLIPYCVGVMQDLSTLAYDAYYYTWPNLQFLKRFFSMQYQIIEHWKAKLIGETLLKIVQLLLERICIIYIDGQQSVQPAVVNHILAGNGFDDEWFINELIKLSPSIELNIAKHLAPLLVDENPDVRARAVKVLCELVNKGFSWDRRDQFIADLIRGLKDFDDKAGLRARVVALVQLSKSVDLILHGQIFTELMYRFDDPNCSTWESERVAEGLVEMIRYADDVITRSDPRSDLVFRNALDMFKLFPFTEVPKAIANTLGRLAGKCILEQTKMEAFFTKLIDRLADNDSDVRRLAAISLVSTTKKGMLDLDEQTVIFYILSTAINLPYAPWVDGAEVSAKALVKIAETFALNLDQEMITQLIAALGNSNQFVREAGVKVLVHMAQTTGLKGFTIDQLIPIIQISLNHYKSAIEVLGRGSLEIEGPTQQKVIAALEAAMQSPGPSVQQAAVYGLVQQGTSQHYLPLDQQENMVNYLLARLGNPDPCKRLDSLKKLGKMAGNVKWFFYPPQKKAFDALIPILNNSDESTEIRIAASEALDQFSEELTLELSSSAKDNLIVTLQSIPIDGSKTLDKLNKLKAPVTHSATETTAPVEQLKDSPLVSSDGLDSESVLAPPAEAQRLSADHDPQTQSAVATQVVVEALLVDVITRQKWPVCHSDGCLSEAQLINAAAALNKLPAQQEPILCDGLGDDKSCESSDDELYAKDESHQDNEVVYVDAALPWEV